MTEAETRQLRVAERHDVADHVVSLDLVDPGGHPLPVWSAGAHIDIKVRPGIVRQYSLCGDPDEAGSWTIGVLKERQGRGGSAAIHDDVEVGDLLEVVGPRNHFELCDARNYVFIAGGIGITPILPMVRKVQAQGVPWSLVYGGRTRSSMAFVDQLERLGQHVDIHPEDEHGLLDLDAAVADLPENSLVYSCGPQVMLDVLEQACSHLPPGTLRMEHFAPVVLSDDSLEHFEVELAESGITLRVGPDDSILELCEDAGLPMLSSCSEGICGTCETRVLEGTPCHLDSVLSDTERSSGEVMMVCVSRSKSSRLVLQL